jgi:hypothetical protein
MKTPFLALALLLLCGACTATTSGIAPDRADVSVRKSCPAFKSGPFTQDSARTYGDEQITTFKNGSRFNCRCLATQRDAMPACQQVRRFVLGNIE